MASSVVYIVFQPGFESSTLKNPENDTPLAFIVPCSEKWCLTSIWPPFDLYFDRKWLKFDLVKVKMVIWWQWNVKSFKATLGCCTLKFPESILDFGGHGGQMEVKTRSDRFGDGIFEKYGQKQSCVQKRPTIGWKLSPRTPPPPLPTLKVLWVERPLFRNWNWIKACT